MKQANTEMSTTQLVSADADRPVFRDRLREYCLKKLSVAIDKLPPISQSKQMTWLYLTEVVRFTDPGLIPEDEEDLEEGYVDGPNDLGVDFLWRQDDKVFLVQSKYHARKGNTPEDEISHFQKVLSRLYNPGNHQINDKLAALRDDIDWENDRFELHFLTLGNVSEAVRSYADQGIVPIKELSTLTDRCSYCWISPRSI